MRKRSLAIVLTVILAGCTAPNERHHQQGVINGDPATDPSVVALMDGDYFYCSGTVISPRVVLTAAHCLEGAPPTGIFFGSDSNNPSSGTVLDVGQTLIHPDYPQMADLGVIELAEPAQVAPSVVNRTALSASMAGQDVRVVGFGLSVDGGEEAGVKLTGFTTFDSLESDYMLVTPQGNQSGCYGDSGGPNFMTIGGAEVLAGITSFGTEDSCLAGMGGNTDAQQYNAWIDDFVEMIEGAPVVPSCQSDGMCVADCATPDPDCPVDPGPDPGGDDDDDGDGGGPGSTSSGCSTGGGHGGFLVLALLVLIAERRRRVA